MTKACTVLLTLALSCLAAASEEEGIQLKVYVDGMSCPTGCAPKVAKGLSSLAGARDVKLADFDKGLFTMALDAKTAIKPKDFEKSLGEYKVRKIEAALTGTLSQKGKETLLTTASGTKYVVFAAGAACCADDAPQAKGAPKKESVEEAAAAALQARIEAMAKDGKTVQIKGDVSECCEVSIAISALEEVKKPAN